MKHPSILSFAFVAVVTLSLLFSPGFVNAADGWARLNPFKPLPAPQWPEWASVKLPEVDLVPDWLKLPDVRKLPGEISRAHNRNMNALGKAVDYLNPFKTEPSIQPLPPPTGSRKTRTVSNSSNSRFWFPSFMNEERKPIGPSRSVSEFLDRPRIR